MLVDRDLPQPDDGNLMWHAALLLTHESFCFFFQKEALAFCLRAAAPPAPRAVLFL
jgi:hypothetical protein